ncbi:MAG: hypothetical protein AAGE88_10040 [Actinomycetota bacterium]
METGQDRRVALAMAVVALLAFLAAVAGIDARATYGARVTADEPQYLITAISLGEDFSLDISDELDEERFLPFHEIRLNQQTIDLDDDGRRVSPHDPLLPLLLALPMAAGGWVAAKLFLSVCAAAVAALTLRLAVTRLGAPLVPATLVVIGFAASPPLSVYGVQVYPAMPAALFVLVGTLAVTRTPRPDGAGRLDPAAVALFVAVVGLPWLSVKYVPVAAMLAAAGLWGQWRRDRRLPIRTVAAYAAAGIVYLVLHRWWYGGWTVYATGDHFVDGEFLVVGYRPNYPGRSIRLIGLLVDKEFGIATWNPAFLALPPALAWFVRTRNASRLVVLAAIGAGYFVATWIAFTMQGWWWPGRQIVPILPLGVAVIAAAVGHRRRALVAVLVGCALGIVSWLILAWEASTDRLTLIVDFRDTSNLWYQLWSRVLPDHQRMDTSDVVLTVVWSLIVIASIVVAYRRSGPAVDAPVQGERVEDGGEPDGPGGPERGEGLAQSPTTTVSDDAEDAAVAT